MSGRTGPKQAVMERREREISGIQRQKEMVIQCLKNRGLRITKQRKLLLDIMLSEECTCCKEIYYKASGVDDSIGAATVYRMIHILEEAGAVSRKNGYRIVCGGCGENRNRRGDACIIELEDDTVYHLSAENWNDVIRAGLKACGYPAQEIRSIAIQPGCVLPVNH